MNEAFRGAGGPGMGGPGGRGPGGRGQGGRGPGGRFEGRAPGARPEGGGFDVPGPPAEEQARRANDEQDPNRADREAGRERGMAGQSPLELDPLIGMDDPSKPLRSKVLAVPQYREKYLANLRKLAEKCLDWNELGPFVAQQAGLIDEGIKAETRKLGSYEAFVAATNAEAKPASPDASIGPRGGHGSMNLQEFADGRRAYLLKSTAK